MPRVIVSSRANAKIDFCGRLLAFLSLYLSGKVSKTSLSPLLDKNEIVLESGKFQNPQLIFCYEDF
jgi:hypothetical protein